jgi:hypothetical protein
MPNEIIRRRKITSNPETVRLQESRTTKTPWRKWGPYLSERQWGTVREDYSQDGNAWDYFSSRPRPIPCLSLGRGWPCQYYGDSFTIEGPTGSGNLMNLFEVAREIANRLTRIFLAMSLAGGRYTEQRRNSRPILTGRITFCSTSISTEIMARAWGRATRLAGRVSSRN